MKRNRATPEAAKSVSQVLQSQQTSLQNWREDQEKAIVNARAALQAADQSLRYQLLKLRELV